MTDGNDAAGLMRIRRAAVAVIRDVRPMFAVGMVITLLLICATATTVVAHSLGRSPGSVLVAETAPDGGLVVHKPKHHAHQASDASHATVARPHHLIVGSLMARQSKPLTETQLSAIRSISGVAKVLVVGDGMARIDGHSARVLSAKPAALRPWTPKLTAASNPLWNSIASGDLTASFEMGTGAKLPLGQTVAVASQHTRSSGAPTRIGAFATVGIAGVDAVVDNGRAAKIGLPKRNAVVISAPQANPLELRSAVGRVLNGGSQTTVLREVVVIRDAGEFMTNKQISAILHAAASRVGKPYVWGAAGPNSFDCSGLVQWSFARAGISMPRVAADQFFTGPHVPYRDARPGDLLFWHYHDPSDPEYVDHVAIYIGNGQMLVAPHTGLDVMVQPVPLADMAGVVRVNPATAAKVAG